MEELGWRVATPEPSNNEGAKPRTSIRPTQRTHRTSIDENSPIKIIQTELLLLAKKHRNFLIPNGHQPANPICI